MKIKLFMKWFGISLVVALPIFWIFSIESSTKDIPEVLTQSGIFAFMCAIFLSFFEKSMNTPVIKITDPFEQKKKINRNKVISVSFFVFTNIPVVLILPVFFFPSGGPAPELWAILLGVIAYEVLILVLTILQWKKKW